MRISSLFKLFIVLAGLLAVGFAAVIIFVVDVVDVWLFAITCASIALVLVALGYGLWKLKPLNGLIDTVRNVKNGNLNVNVNLSQNKSDEIGILQNDIGELVLTVKSMVTDLNQAHNQYINVGNMHFEMDESKYQNSFREAISLVNRTLLQTADDIEGIGNVLKQIGDGDFNVTMDESVWVGEWSFIPNIINDFTTNLRKLTAEIHSMIDATAVRGDLDFRIDADSYSGDWKELIKGLNSIAQGVDTPLKVIGVALTEIGKGNFCLENTDTIITSMGIDPNPNSYGGVYRDAIHSFDAAMIQTFSYIDELKSTLGKMADGDLRVSINRDYVGSFNIIKNSVNEIKDKLHKTVSEISMVTDQVFSGAGSVAHSATELANGAQKQADHIHRLDETMKEISGQTKRNADDASHAHELSTNSASNAESGNMSMQQMVETMMRMKEASSDISGIIQTIENIAFQTNLLALNASVEAARAGEHGRGFAVVAEEVRTLASRSSTAAAETTTLIQDTLNRVESGSSIAESTAQSLSSIVESAGEVLNIVGSISAASNEQTNIIASVSEGLHVIAEVTQSNSGISQETAASSEELNTSAEMLSQLVGYFKL